MRSMSNCLQTLVAHHLVKRREKNPYYSLRAFARDVGLSPATVSLFLRGKSSLSAKSHERLLCRLGIPAGEAKEVLVEERGGFDSLETEQFVAVADWQHFAVLSLVELEDFQSDKQKTSGPLHLVNPKGATPFELVSEMKRALSSKSEIISTTGQIQSMVRSPSEVLTSSRYPLRPWKEAVAQWLAIRS